MFGVSSLFFGSQREGPTLHSVADGHRAISIVVEGKTLTVDVDILADVSGLFLQVQSSSAKEFQLEDFPGGVAAFRQIINLLTNPKEQVTLHVHEENILNLFEAAWLLECPRIFDEIMDSPYMRSLSSRRKVELLETLLPFTTASSPSEGFVEERSLNDDSVGLDEFMRTLLLESKMWQRTESAAIELCAQLDTNDFVLGPRLATGSLRVSCEILRLQKQRGDEAGFVSNAFLPVTAMWKNLTDKPLRGKVSWDAHLYALHCMRKRLPSNPSEQAPSEAQEDAQARVDISEETCDLVSDSVLLSLVELVSYADMQRTPPNWACLLVRALLLSNRMEDARQAFKISFASSPRVQQLAWQQPVSVPPSWLAEVAEHWEASQALLRVLQGFQDMAADQLCDIIEDVLLEQFLALPHAAPVILASELVNDIVGACFEAGRKACAPQNSEAIFRLCSKQWAGQHVISRLHYTGARLFSAAFVPQKGFLPHTWPDCLGSGSVKLSEDEIRVPDEPTCQLEPLVMTVSGHCLWDEGLLQVQLLRSVMAAGRAAPQEPILHFGRQVIMRHLWYSHTGTYLDVQRLKELWELACWPLCEDAGLIREALEYLKGVSRELYSFGGTWSPENENIVFQMFAALDLAKLPVQALLSPWVPPQVQTVFLLVQQQPYEQYNSEVKEEIDNGAESLKHINHQCSKLANKLNIVEQRTLINKSQINDAMLAIEEHQRRKSEAAARKLKDAARARLQ